MREPGQHPDQGAVAGRDRGIGGGLGAGDQRLGVVGRKKIAAARRVPIMPVEDRDPVARLREKRRRRRSPRGAPARRGTDWRNRRRSPDAGPGRRASCASSRPSAPVISPRTKSKAARASVDPVRPLEHHPGIGQRRDHQPVPVGQHLVVPARAAPAARAPATAGRGSAPVRARSRHRPAPANCSRLRMVWPSQLPSGVTS